MFIFGSQTFVCMSSLLGLMGETCLVQDICEVCPEKLPNYEEKVKMFFEEHLHIDEEIRYCLAGSGRYFNWLLYLNNFDIINPYVFLLYSSWKKGYFDVRDLNDVWIRVWVKRGGMIVFPSGIYHPFTVDSNNYMKVQSLASSSY